jgi:hypothetical protein
MIPVSDALKELLCRHGMSAKSLAGDEARNERAGRGQSGAAPQVTLGMSREEDRCLTDEPSPQRQQRPVLRVINGKCLPRVKTPCSPSNALGRHLQLVWSA